MIDSIAESRRVDAIRRDFVANVSHELKTPVGAISLLAEALEGDQDVEDRKRLTEMLRREATRVGDIIDDPRAQEFITDLGGTRVLTDAYLALELGMIGSIVCVYAMQATMRLRTEETSWRADAVLGTATARIRWR